MNVRVLIVFTVWMAVSPLGAQTISFLMDHFDAIPGDTATERRIFELVNQERAQRGLPRLEHDRPLRSAARQHSQEMMDMGYFSHTSPVASLKDPIDRIYRSGLSDASIGENIAYYAYDTTSEAAATRLMELWMNSPGHRDNILRAEFNRIGIGIVSRPDSIVIDTVIGGRAVRRVARTIVRYATQNFSNRHLAFDQLDLVYLKRRMISLDLVVMTDRTILAQMGHQSVLRASKGGFVHVRMDHPQEDTLTLSLAYLENDHTGEYVRFLHVPMNKSRDELAAALSSARMRGSLRRHVLEDREYLWLRGNGSLVRAREQDLYVYRNRDTYFHFVGLNGRFEFSIPLDNVDTVTVEWAVGNVQVKPMTNRIRIRCDVVPRSDISMDRSRMRQIFMQEY